MTIRWFQLVGGSHYGVSGADFSGVAQDRVGDACSDVEADVVSEFDGARWLLQKGYERISLDIEFRAEKKGRQRRSVAEIGRLLDVSYSVVWPELANATVPEIREYLKPVVLEALEFAGERKGLGSLVPVGTEGELRAVPLRPLIEDPMPYVEKQADCFVITRELPPDLSPSETADVLARYDSDLERLLTKRALGRIVELETSGNAVRWAIEVPERRR
jgi:hypothetical protein